MPHRGGSDYDEDDATTLDPFSIQENELVRVPTGGATDAMREDLKADPDVQDALRWLDPPSNAGPPVAAAAAAADPHQPPMRHPSAPGYPQVYTPVPQPYPGAGPYPTPVPAYVPSSGAYYLATPMPGPMAPQHMPSQAVPAPAARSPILWIILTALVTGGGIALGWWMFAGRNEQPAARSAAPPANPAATPTAPQPTPTAPQPTPPVPVEPAPTPAEPAPTAPPAKESVTAEVASIAPATFEPVAAPLAGTISKVFLAAPGKVATGDKLVEIRSDSGGGARAKKLAARVAELEQLAKDDPVYEEFLADARKAERAAHGSTKLTVVKAPAGGRAQIDVKEGESVARGKPVAQLSTGGDWIVKATAKGEVLRSWSCQLAGSGEHRAPCTIDKVVASAAGSDITATVKPKDAPWLEDAAEKPTLVLDPP